MDYMQLRIQLFHLWNWKAFWQTRLLLGLGHYCLLCLQDFMCWEQSQCLTKLLHCWNLSLDLCWQVRVHNCFLKNILLCLIFLNVFIKGIDLKQLLPELVERFFIISPEVECMSLCTKSRLYIPEVEGIGNPRNEWGQKEPPSSIRWLREDM